jgi:hypothetical protein
MSDRESYEPRPGVPGVWDRVVGPGASAAENAGTLFYALAGGVAPLWAARGEGWSAGRAAISDPG